MAVMIDDDLRKFGLAIIDLEKDPSDILLRRIVHEASSSVWLSAMEAATTYTGVIEDVGWIEGKTRAQQIQEGFEKALGLMSPICDDYFRAVQSRWDGLKRTIEPAGHTT